MKASLRIALAALFIASCTKSDPSQSAPATATVPTIAPNPAAVPPSSGVVLRVKAIDMEGKPVPNMVPIATMKPNAFDAPVAKGDLTATDGSGSLSIPGDQYLYVRTWDPIKQLFANNYYDVLPGNAAPKEELVVTMLPASSLDVDMLDANGAGVANQPIGMMMSHPVHGPWWPAESQTGAQGRAHFGPLPPGKYVITLETRDHRHVDLPEQTLLPNQTTEVGPVTLR